MALQETETRLAPAVEGEPAPESFAARFSSRRRDLVAAAENGIEPPETIPGSGGVLLRGVRHYEPLPRKVGKSISTQVTAVDIVLAGGTVAILDRENGESRYALRLSDIMEARDLDRERRELLRGWLRYYAYPRVEPGDERELVRELKGADLVVFDASRPFLTSLGLKENDSDDFSAFMATMIDPLHEAGIATLTLDNTGWGDTRRGRGSSAKEDLHDHIFTGKKTKPFGRETVGEIRLEVKESREGLDGAWTMRIGGGVYDPWVPADADDDEPDPPLLESVSRYVERKPGANKRDVRAAVGNSRNAEKDAALDWLLERRHLEDRGAGRAHAYHPAAPYRA